MAIEAVHPEDATDDEWPTTLRFSRQLGEFHRDGAYGEAIEGPYVRFSSRAWDGASAWLAVVLLTLVVGHIGYWWLKATPPPRDSVDAAVSPSNVAAKSPSLQAISSQNLPAQR